MLYVVVVGVCCLQEPSLVGEGELGQARDARPQSQDLAEAFLLKCNESGILGPRPDKAHLAREDVPELGNLIELGTGQELAETVQAHVLCRRQRKAGRAGMHLPELEHEQRPTVLASTATTEEDPPGALESNRQRDRGDCGQHEQEQERRDRDVDRTDCEAVERQDPASAESRGATGKPASHPPPDTALDSPPEVLSAPRFCCESQGGHTGSCPVIPRLSHTLLYMHEEALTQERSR